MLKSLSSILAVAAAGALLATPALAQEVPEHGIFILNSLLFLVGGVLVMFMACGFCMLEVGLVRAKNTTMQLTKNVALFSIAAIGYYIIGYNLMYPLGTWSVEGVLSGVIGVAAMEAVGVAPDAADDLGYASTASDYFFQLMFCAATASIVSGTLAERIKLWPFLLFTLILTALIYPFQGKLEVGGGFLDEMGFLDFAGSTRRPPVGGWAALAGALVLGARTGKYRTAASFQCLAPTCRWRHSGHSSCGSAGSASTAARSLLWALSATSPMYRVSSPTPMPRRRAVPSRP